MPPPAPEEQEDRDTQSKRRRRQGNHWTIEFHDEDSAKKLRHDHYEQQPHHKEVTTIGNEMRSCYRGKYILCSYF